MISTLDEAAALIKELGICTIFQSTKTELPALWEHVDLPDKQPGERGWGRKMEAVWTWKNQLPAKYPKEFFYGKIKGGIAVLMTLDHLQRIHFPAAYKPIGELNLLSRKIYEKIRIEPWETTHLRNAATDDYLCSKSQFDTALKNLQISLNVVRLNDPEIERDTWVTFRELYPDIWDRHVPE